MGTRYIYPEEDWSKGAIAGLNVSNRMIGELGGVDLYQTDDHDFFAGLYQNKNIILNPDYVDIERELGEAGRGEMGISSTLGHEFIHALDFQTNAPKSGEERYKSNTLSGKYLNETNLKKASDVLSSLRPYTEHGGGGRLERHATKNWSEFMAIDPRWMDRAIDTYQEDILGPGEKRRLSSGKYQYEVGEDEREHLKKWETNEDIDVTTIVKALEGIQGYGKTLESLGMGTGLSLKDLATLKKSKTDYFNKTFTESGTEDDIGLYPFSHLYEYSREKQSNYQDSRGRTDRSRSSEPDKYLGEPKQQMLDILDVLESRSPQGAIKTLMNEKFNIDAIQDEL